MTLPVLIHPLASAEVVDAQLWYEERAAGLGDRFIVAFRSATDRAARWPNAGAPLRDAMDGSVAERQIATRAPPTPSTSCWSVGLVVLRGNVIREFIDNDVDIGSKPGSWFVLIASATFGERESSPRPR